MTPDWTDLDQELTEWSRAGLTLPLWWRDDDATAPSNALTRLANLAQKLDMPVHLAVIPAEVDDRLGHDLPNRMIPVVHGWRHANHAPADTKKAEFGPHRPLAKMQAEARAGLAHLDDQFGTALLPMFVPPWNRIDQTLLPSLSDMGYRWLSTFTPRTSSQAAPGLVRINTHLDPVFWKGNKGLADPDKLVSQVAQQLKDRREGQADKDEPYGILTHHLVHDDAIWTFTEELLSRLLSGPAWVWTAPQGEWK